MLESEIEKKLKDKIHALGHGVKCLKFISPGFSGVPDRIILLPGAHVIFVELKKPGKKERKRQLYVQNRLRKLGFDVYSAVSSIEQIEGIVQQCREVINGEGIYTA